MAVKQSYGGTDTLLICVLYHLSSDDRQRRVGQSPVSVFPVVHHSCQPVRADGRLIDMSGLTETP